MRLSRKISTLALVLLFLAGSALAQNGNLAERQKAPTVLGGTGLFNTFSTRTLCKGEFNFAIFWNNFDRDPGDIDINQVPFNFTVGLTNRWELWVNWVTWQNTTSRNPFLLSGYQYNAVRLFGDPVELIGPPVGGTGGSTAFFQGTGVLLGGILPAIGRFGPSGGSFVSPGGAGGPQVRGLGPAFTTDLPSFYNDLPFFGEVDFIGFDSVGRPVLGPRQSSNGTGDVYVGTKVNLIDANKSWFSMALGGYLKIPISRDDHARARGRTSGELEYGPILMFGQESGGKRFRVYENVSYIHTGDIHKAGVKVLDLRDKFLFNVGTGIAINRHAEFVAEVNHTRYVGGGSPSIIRNNPVDLNIGLRFFLRDGAISFGGGYRRFLNNDEARDFEVFRVIPCTDPTLPICKERLFERFEDNSDGHGFVGYFSIGRRKECPLPPAPTCVLATAPTAVNRGDRLTLTVRPTTPGYADDKVTYEYRWEVRDSQGRPVTVNGTGPSVDVPTARLACGSYTVTTTVTASVSAVDCPSDCVTTGQTSCSASFEVTEPPCPPVSCEVTASPSSVMEGERVTLRVTGSTRDNLSYSWSTTGGRLSSQTGAEVTLNTTGVAANTTITVTVNVTTDRSRCDEPCPGGSCSVTVGVRSVPPALPPPEIIVPCGPIFFPFNSARINNEHKACLDEIALRLQQDPRAALVIDGHRDSAERVGISLTRANNARDYLVNERGVDAARITVRNFGDTCPQELGDPNLNRRVEFWIIPEGSNISQIDTMKRCAGGATPRVITGEEPAVEQRRPPRRTPRRNRRPEPAAQPEEESALQLDGHQPASRQAGGASGRAENEPRTVPARTGAGVAVRAATVVHSVRAEVVGGVLRVVVDADGALNFNDFVLASPSRIVIDLSGVRHGFGNKIIPVGAGPLDRVRVGQPEAGVVRIVLDVKGGVPYQVMREGASLIIVIADARLTSELDRTGENR